MTIYCDTSVLVSAFAAEAASESVREWLDRHADKVVISDWVVNEFSGALALKRRIGAIDQASWLAVMQDWRAFLRDGIPVEQVVPRDFARAAAILEQPDLKLRSSDALHLALAEDRGFAMATLDKALGDAADMVRVPRTRVLT
ncbi:type II toxin-antitoxin system VapC family toxin [Sphingomonas ginsenosidivorax]|uniref:Ribonuclease VapC n=1 Tax=Sphingomonas ginsenosidivorax TaxID=862135 RepID=A0A5C6UJ31_9SPHN|nr:type II toxin-antitoxin system VapC family toxin [Sphingomonas ginsenosidivorax]TXC72414.1 type II toxin-antitoxin system VapC family toxin [Sphingomonas ginsenosidivorax]